MVHSEVLNFFAPTNVFGYQKYGASSIDFIESEETLFGFSQLRFVAMSWNDKNMTR